MPAGVDPFAGFEDRGPARDRPPLPWERGGSYGFSDHDPWAAFEDRGPNSEAARPFHVPTAAAVAEGALDTAGAGFRDEIYGLSEASGLPEWMGGLRAPIGAAKLRRGQIGFGGTYFGGRDETQDSEVRASAVQKYEEARDVARGVQREAQEQHPGAYLGGQLGGAVLTPGFAATKGATIGARAGRAAIAGATQGGLYGVGSGEDPAGRAIGGAEGAALGGITGAVASPLLDVAGIGLQKAGHFIKSTYDTLRAELNPQVGRQIADDEAAKRIVAAHLADRESQAGPAWSDEEIEAADRAGIPRALGDIGGERTLALARSAANQSPEARAALTNVAQDRFAGQTRRAAGFIKELTGGADAAGDLEAIKERARIANAPAYARAYRAGDRPIWSPELERLSGSPSIRAAMKSAITSGQDRSIEEGMGAFNPGLQVTQDGRILFTRTSPTGGPVYPNLQLWDYVQRDLADAVEKVQGREPDKGRYLNSLHQQLNTELDRLVPQFQNARMGAWRAFQSQDALEAGKKFVTAQGRNGDYARILANVSEPDKQLFARGFASELADRVLELRDNQNIVSQAFLTSPAAKQRIAMALGPDRAAKLEMYLRAETLSDRLRTALGNSTTARQLAEMGLAGAGTLAIGHGAMEGEWDAKHALTAALLFGAAYGKHRYGALQTSAAQRIGEMLASNDPAILNRGVQIVAKSRTLSNALRTASDRIGAAVAGRIAPTGAVIATH